MQADILVIGGGPAGVAAAVAAARQGQQVTLVEKAPFLGGKATAAEVGTICGLYTFSRQKQSTYIVQGFAKEFAEAVRTGSNSHPIHSLNGLHYLPYDISVFKNTCAQLLLRHHVTVYCNSQLTGIGVDNGIIHSANILIEGRATTMAVKEVVDCSGESIVCKTGGLPLLKSDHFQAAAQVFTLQNVLADGLSEASMGMLLIRELTHGIRKKELEHYCDRVYIVPGSLKGGQLSIKVGIPLPVTHLPGNIENLKSLAITIIDTLVRYLKTHVPIFENCSLQSIAPEVGIRSGLRGKGKYMLTEEDVLGCKKTATAIANASWPIEEWEQDRRVRMQYFAPDDFYQIPAGCLQAYDAANLFFAGRHISATDSAIASARVIGICLQTGYAAGCLAAAHLLGIAEPETIQQIQESQLLTPERVTQRV